MTSTEVVLFLHKTPGWRNDSTMKVYRWLLTSNHCKRQQLPRGQTGRCVRHLDTCCSLTLCSSLVFTSHFSSGDLSCPWGAVRRQQLSQTVFSNFQVVHMDNEGFGGGWLWLKVRGSDDRLERLKRSLYADGLWVEERGHRLPSALLCFNVNQKVAKLRFSCIKITENASWGNFDPDSGDLLSAGKHHWR